MGKTGKNTKNTRGVTTYYHVGYLRGLEIVGSRYGKEISPGGGKRLRPPTKKEMKQIQQLLKKQKQTQIVEIKLEPGVKHLILHLTKAKNGDIEQNGPGPTDLTWEEENPIDYRYRPVDLPKVSKDPKEVDK